MASSSSPPSSSSPAQPPQPPAQPQQQQQNQRQLAPNTNPYIHNVALGVTPVALLALFLPPRRLDARALVLGGVALWGTNQLAYDYTGTSTLGRVGQRFRSLAGAELPEQARETQARLRAERARRADLQVRARAQLRDGGGALTEEEERRRRRRGKEREEGEEEEEGEERGLLERVWMGDSGDDWKEKREQREREALSEGGGGYWKLIVDQVSEVWSQQSGKKKDGEDDKGSDQKRGDTSNDSKKT